ncbi:hypothetical protein BDW62DRAFT_22749 [Aspergillus aurantiobrunneus]
MAAAVQPSGLMDIASSLTQDEIPFKLRCAICNKLAVNAFRLPCCEQAICENCQTSLPDTCPVCAHTPISSDLCKPNKALRTTLKAFLRTEEKKREKERQAALPATPDDVAHPEETSVKQDPQQVPNAVEETPTNGIRLPEPTEVSAAPLEDATPAVAESNVSGVKQGATNGISQDESPENVTPATVIQTRDAEQNDTVEGDTVGDNESSPQLAYETPQDATPGAGFPNPMGLNMNLGMFPNMMWGANPMAQFMGNGMMGFPNPMGMAAMGMDPMAANQGMFGGFGMNMNGMSNGMNMGINFNAGQGMYGDWDGSQNNMWNGSQDKFNPNAFANGMGAQFGDPSGFGGYNMSQPNGVHPQMQQQQFPNQEFQNGYYGPGNYRGRGRGYYPGGRGRGGYSGHMQPNFPHNANSLAAQDNVSSSVDQSMPSQPEEGATGATAPGDNISTEGRNTGDRPNAADDAESTKDLGSKDLADKPDGGNLESVPGADGLPDQGAEEHQLQGIPTIDSLDQTNSASSMGAPTPINQGFGRGGFMRGGFHGRGGSFGGQQFNSANNMQPRGPGVEGAPAAPRAMRQGLPNTSVLRQRNFQASGRTPMPQGKSTETSETPRFGQAQQDQHHQSTSRSISKARSRSKSKSRSRSRTQSRSNSRRRYRQRSRSVEDGADDYDRPRDRHRSRRDEKERLAAEDGRRTRSPSIESHRSSRYRDKGRDRRSRRSRRSHRRRSRSRSASTNRNGDSRDDEHLASVDEERSDSKARSRNVDSLESSTHRSRKDRSSRRDRHREKERERDRERDRPRERERDRKRPRRDRSESAVNSDYYSKKAKRGREDDVRSSTNNRERANDARDKSPPSSKPSESEKDPHTLEREARNRERLLKEQQRREAMHADRDSGKASRRRDSRQERTGRRVNYKYDDEADAARTERVEREREASRWD